jgi:hypothetical protein
MHTDSANDWWAAILADRTADGRRDAERGQYDLPYPGVEEDPQYEDENEAYKIGWHQRRKELGDAFQWA